MPVSVDATTGQHLGDQAGAAGPRRDHSEQATARHSAVVILADGAGGYKGGAAAADQVIGAAANLFEAFSPKDQSPEELLREIVLEAHTVIRLNRVLTEQEPHSTIIAMVLQPDRVDWGWVGDSRLYHFRGPAVQHRTKDHSYVEQQIDEGQWREEDRHKHPNRNLLLQALGHSEPPVPSFGSAPRRSSPAMRSCSAPTACGTTGPTSRSARRSPRSRRARPPRC